jgi:multidrug resistance efflux pump
MLDFIKRRLQSDRGAMDKILVTLLLVVVGIGAVVGLSTWLSSQSDTIKTDAATTVNSLKNN